MNKKLLHKSIMESLSKTLGKTLNEGAGAGYDVTIKGLTATNIEVLGKETKGNDEIVKFHAELVPGQVEWKAQDYYDGLDSTGIFYDGTQVEEFDDEQRHVDGGEIYGYVYLQDVEGYDNAYGTSEEEEVTNYIEDQLVDFEFKAMYGGGWAHVNLDDPMVFDDVKIAPQYREWDTIFIDEIIINAPDITSTINWFFENRNNFEEIYGLTDEDNEDLDESVKIKTKKKSITEDLTKADKEDAESKMDKWHEGKRKQNVKACSTDKLIMNLGICKRKGYDSEAQQIQDELDSRGINESQLFERAISEHNYGPKFDEVIEHVKNGTIDTEKDSEILFDALVPWSGHADTLAGELLRAAERIAYRYYNDGDRVGEGYGRETVNPAVRFMKENVPTTSLLCGIVRDFYRFIDYGCSVDDKEYEFMVMQLLKLTVIHIVENKLWEIPNQEDMHDYKDPNVDVDWNDWDDGEEDDWDDSESDDFE